MSKASRCVRNYLSDPKQYTRLGCVFQGALHKTRMRIPSSTTQDSDAYSKEHDIRLGCVFQAALHKTRMRIPRSTTRVEDATDPEKPPSVIISPRF